MIAYLLKSGICLAILLAFYHLVLEREKMHHFNRFYLLGSVIFSFLAPLLVIYVEVQPDVTTLNDFHVSKGQLITTKEMPHNQTSDFYTYLFGMYLLVSSLLFVRFCVSLFGIFQKIKENTITHYQSAKIVLVNDAILPHTFWNYIFINKKEYEAKKVEKELFTHELTHVTQRHTIDVLILEVLQIVLWFNPFFYPLKKAIQLNHEFLADDKVIASHHNISRYQYLLIDKAAWKNKYYLASNLNYSLTKKRLLMMKTQNSRKTILLKKMAVLPLLTGLAFLFAERVEAQTTRDKKPVKIQVVEISATDAEMEEYQKLIGQSEKKKIFSHKDVLKMRNIYQKMSKKQKSSVTNINDLLPPPPPPMLTDRKQISKEKFEELKDALKYAVWIDQRLVDNKELAKRKHTDFVTYTGSFVHKNARSKKFPQPYQYQLYTESFYKKMKAYKVTVKDVPPPPPPKKVKEIKNEKGEVVYPVKIQVVEVSKNSKGKLPPPQRKKDKASKLLKNKKGEVIKPVKIEVIKKAKKPQVIEIKEKKTIKEVVIEEVKELQEIEVVEEKETAEEIEVIEEKEIVEVAEVNEVLKAKEIEIVEESEEAQETEVILKEPIQPNLKLEYKKLKKQGATFYLNGKKISSKEAKKYFYDKSHRVQDMEIQKKDNKIIKVDINTEGRKQGSKTIKKILSEVNAYANRNNLNPAKNRNNELQKKQMMKNVELLNTYSNTNSLLLK